MTNAVNDDSDSPNPSALTWKVIGPGLWIGSDLAGPTAIVTEVWTEGFEAALTSGRSLGRHPTAAAAREAAEGARNTEGPASRDEQEK